MEFGRAFTFAFEDKDWLKKIGIAGLVMLIPLLGQIIVMGWAIEIMRRVIQRDAELLPDWSNFGEFLTNGLKGFVIGLVYALPIILLQACVQGGMLAFVDPNDPDMQNTYGLVSGCVGCLAAILGLVIGLFQAGAITKFAATDNLGAAFRFGEVFNLVKAAPGAWILALFGAVIAGMLSAFGVILCIIGVVFVAAWAFAVQGHLYGQAYNQAAGAAGALTPNSGAQAF